jgi:hypothetical protein
METVRKTMNIAFESDLFLPSISKTISILTDRANICLDDIHYDETNGIVEIIMQRKELTGFKKPFFSEMQPVYSQKMIQSLLTIKQVVEMKIKVDDKLVDDCKSCFTVLFGLRMNENELYIGSAEETQGKVLCQLFIKVKWISIEFGDYVKF